MSKLTQYGYLLASLLFTYYAVNFTRDIHQISNNIAKFVYIFNLQVAEVEETK